MQFSSYFLFLLSINSICTALICSIILIDDVLAQESNAGIQRSAAATMRTASRIRFTAIQKIIR
jgi:hypothetical protein